MIRREAKGDKTRITFVLPRNDPEDRVSVVGDFNDWTPGAHRLVARSNGTRSVAVLLSPGRTYKFRYLTEGGLWFDDPEAEHDGENGVVSA